MAQAQSGNTVKVHYTGKLDDGTVFDSSRQREEPLEFTLGEQQLIPGFEAAVVGMEPGETKTVNIPAEEAYGERREGLSQQVERDQLPEGLELELGGQLAVPTPDGQKAILTITEMNDESITLDANHPLAGQDLTFEIELVEVAG